MTTKGQKFGWKKEIFGIILKKVIEKIFGWKIVKCLGRPKKGNWEFGVPGNVILQKALGARRDRPE